MKLKRTIELDWIQTRTNRGLPTPRTFDISGSRHFNSIVSTQTLSKGRKGHSPEALFSFLGGKCKGGWAMNHEMPELGY
jgi:hypothetical protein